MPIGQMRRFIRNLAWRLFPSKMRDSIDVRKHWIDVLNIDLLIDVGANEGQYTGWMRRRGYTGPIVSFEPQATAFAKCQQRWAGDPAWAGVCCALGEKTCETEMYIAGNSVSSSLLPMLDTHVEVLRESAIVRRERVRCSTLNDEMEALGYDGDRIYLKIDAQGYELPVLRGASEILDRVAVIELELSLVPLYQDQDLLAAVWEEVTMHGYTPIWVEQGFSDFRAAKMLQIDGMFVRTGFL